MNIHAYYIVCINGCPKVPLAIKWSSVDVASHGLKQRVEIERPNLCELFEKFSQTSGTIIESKIQILIIGLSLLYFIKLFFNNFCQFHCLKQKVGDQEMRSAMPFMKQEHIWKKKKKRYFFKNKIDMVWKNLNSCKCISYWKYIRSITRDKISYCILSYYIENIRLKDRLHGMYSFFND